MEQDTSDGNIKNWKKNSLGMKKMVTTPVNKEKEEEVIEEEQKGDGQKQVTNGRYQGLGRKND